jgi:hypothetical protein
MKKTKNKKQTKKENAKKRNYIINNERGSLAEKKRKE